MTRVMSYSLTGVAVRRPAGAGPSWAAAVAEPAAGSNAPPTRATEVAMSRALRPVRTSLVPRERPGDPTADEGVFVMPQIQ
ncbi:MULTISPECIES: hypothetical protein [unclassified Streptomyces]|uniref:hypothetical protein n=1 Tax=unclassified Streptomyces TaxID=2593676 RepID=UPI0036FD7F29